METEHVEVITTDTLTEGFSRIPHTLFNVLLLLELTSRERRVIELILRLTYGCLGQRWARFSLSDLQVVGIGKNHAREVIDGLLQKQFILKHDKTKAYRLNNEYFISEVTKSGTFKIERLAELVGRQLRRNWIQNRNQEVPETGTNPLPKEELDSSLSGNSKRFPNREHLALDNHFFEESKDNLNIIKNSDIDRVAVNNSSTNDYKVLNPKNFIPSNEGEAAAYEAWNQLEHTNPFSFTTTYYAAYKKGLPPSLFYQFSSEIKQDESIKNKGAVFNSKVVGYFEERRSGQ